MPFSNRTKRQRWEKGQVVPEYNTIMMEAPKNQNIVSLHADLGTSHAETKRSGMLNATPLRKTQVAPYQAQPKRQTRTT
ncbi:MAG: hypothetical protein WA157_15380 [Rhodoferax ferrireducens]|jgi:hypothetical protein